MRRSGARSRKPRTTNPNQTADELFWQLGQITRGWALYFRHGASKAAFQDLDHFLWWRTLAWLVKKHPKAKQEVDPPALLRPRQVVARRRGNQTLPTRDGKDRTLPISPREDS